MRILSITKVDISMLREVYAHFFSLFDLHANNAAVSDLYTVYLEYVSWSAVALLVRIGLTIASKAHMRLSKFSGKSLKRTIVIDSDGH